MNRCRSHDPQYLYSCGRGGAGNVYTGDGIIAETIDKDDCGRFISRQDGQCVVLHISYIPDN